MYLEKNLPFTPSAGHVAGSIRSPFRFHSSKLNNNKKKKELSASTTTRHAFQSLNCFQKCCFHFFRFALFFFFLSVSMCSVDHKHIDMYVYLPTTKKKKRKTRKSAKTRTQRTNDKKKKKKQDSADNQLTAPSPLLKYNEKRKVKTREKLLCFFFFSLLLFRTA